MEWDPAEDLLEKEQIRPCDFCGHPVKEASTDEYDCPACGGDA
jgi:rubrerythrin